MNLETGNSNNKVSIYDYIFVIYKHRAVVIICALAVTVLAGIAFKLLVQKYKIGYTYNKLKITVVDYELFLDRFYSQENIDWLINGLRETNCQRYAEKLEKCREKGRAEILKYISFQVWPENLDQISLEFMKVEDIKELADFPVKMLRVEIVDSKSTDLKKIGEVIRDNIEECLPMYNIKDSLTMETIMFREKIALIQKNRRSSELEIIKDKSILDKLMKIEDTQSTDSLKGIVLQIDLGEQGVYMPVDYQIRAAKSNIILSEEDIQLKIQEEQYYQLLLDSNTSLIDEMNKNENQQYSVTNFLATVKSLSDSVNSEILKDHLRAFCQEIENVKQRNIPATQTPRLQRTGGLKRVLILSLIASFAMGALAAFVIEGMKYRETNE